MTRTLSWTPDISGRSGPKYLAIADTLADDIQAGRLEPGDRLPPHRDLAYFLNLTVGTVTRAYREAERKGLLNGEVGRGTYVRSPNTIAKAYAFTHDRDDGAIDLSLNRPPSADQRLAGPSLPIFREIASELSRAPNLGDLLDYCPPEGREDHRQTAAKWSSRIGMDITADEIVITNGGQHALALLLTTLCKPGDGVLIEELSYPSVKLLADRFGLRLHAVAMDDDGMRPDALEAAYRTSGAKTVFIVPCFQNPTSIYMPEKRRQAIAEVATRHSLTILEDDVYGFQRFPRPVPIAAFAPDNTCLIISTKGVAPGLRVGFLRLPPQLLAPIKQALQLSSWMTSPLTADITCRLIESGGMEEITRWNRTEAEARGKIARRVLGNVPHTHETGSYHLWLPLPAPWTSESFVDAARQRGVLLIGAETFATGRAPPPQAVRICLGCGHSRERLEEGLGIVKSMLESGPPAPQIVM